VSDRVQTDCPPVLLLIYHRADLTQQVFDRIRQARPRRLFVAADGPRADVPGDDAQCAAARAAVRDVDWVCNVSTLLRETNLGCRTAVATAISWFFEHVDDGIILEDDCMPHATFFPYCAELLARYRTDERVMAIGGNNFRAARAKRADKVRSSEVTSYTFAVHPQIWGWATWRRAWVHYDDSMMRWWQLRETNWVETFLAHAPAARYWREVFERDARGEIDTWDFAWTFACWVNNGLTAHPAVNLVSNIGFDDRALHTRNVASPLANVPARAITFPLVHPPDVRRDVDADRFTAEFVHRVRLRTSPWRRALERVRTLLPPR
jgi:hypothetical protein